MKEYGDKKYTEPVQIGQIIDDMGFGKKALINIINKQFAEDILATLTKYISITQQFDAEYRKSSRIILDLEHYWQEETLLLDQFTKALARGENPGKDIDHNSTAVQSQLEILDGEFNDLCLNLLHIMNQFSDKEDQNSCLQKIDSFHALFKKIYDETTDICCA